MINVEKIESLPKSRFTGKLLAKRWWLFLTAAFIVLAIGLGLGARSVLTANNDMANCSLTGTPCGSDPTKCRMGTSGGGMQCLYRKDYPGHPLCSPCS